MGLDNLTEFVLAHRATGNAASLPLLPGQRERYEAGNLYCPHCGGERRMDIEVL